MTSDFECVSTNLAVAVDVAHDQLRELDLLLDRAAYRLASGADVHAAINELMVGLLTARSVLGEEWPAAVNQICRTHPLYDLLSADPITQRARAKPRGYAGDAVMLDYIYSGLAASERASVSEFGAALFQATTSSPSAVAVRDRRDLLAARIDACARRVAKPRILSVACGHLREAELSTAVMERRIETLVALDQDPASLAVVRDMYSQNSAIVPLNASVRDLLRGTVEVSNYDLIYTAGLYDYLPEAVASRLTGLLFQGLAHNGELLIGNFLSDYPTSGYLEGFMDWWLLGRSPVELRGLAASIPDPEIACASTTTDRTNCVAYLTLVRR